MTLQDVFDLLTQGELAQLSIGGNAAGIIDETNHFRIIPHINLALSSLYNRFPLKEKRVTFALQAGLYTYTLQVSDLIRIERIYTADDTEVTLNKAGDKYSCVTTSAKVIIVPVDIVDGALDLPELLRTGTLDVVYRAQHPKLVERDALIDPENIELELPYTYLEPLLYFVAARVHAPAGSGQFEGLISNNYMQKYEQAVQQLITLNPQVELYTDNTQFNKKGWA